MIEMFTDATAGESYAENRLITEETDAGTVRLTAYGWITLAEYDETEEHVTVYFGHKEVGSRTISRWLNSVLEQAADRRRVTISHESPVVRKPNDGVRFINHYINFNDMSPVEESARRAVIESLAHLSDVV